MYIGTHGHGQHAWVLYLMSVNIVCYQQIQALTSLSLTLTQHGQGYDHNKVLTAIIQGEKHHVFVWSTVWSKPVIPLMSTSNQDVQRQHQNIVGRRGDWPGNVWYDRTGWPGTIGLVYITMTMTMTMTITWSVVDRCRISLCVIMIIIYLWSWENSMVVHGMYTVQTMIDQDPRVTRSPHRNKIATNICSKEDDIIRRLDIFISNSNINVELNGL